ncbi:MAG: diguanylate cyclase [Alphaproteobacteria bacterium]|nr:diguanylate cyclase [Alphaproteobacteria bacterium]
MTASPYAAATNLVLIEDTDSDAALVQSYLAGDDGDIFHIRHAPTLKSALPLFSGEPIDAVMLDLMLPDTEELSGLQNVQSVAPHVPVIILTGRDDVAVAEQAVAGGAQDYLLKDKIDRNSLRRSLRYAMQRKKREKSMQALAHYDALTGLANRYFFQQRLAAAMARHDRSGQPVALMMIDLDGFKSVNDRHGHAAGDAVLREIGRRIPQCLRPYDLAGRFGGDEFTILIENAESNAACAAIARKLVDMIQRPVIACARQMTVGASIGIAVSHNGNADPEGEDLLRRADAAMYRAKKHKGGAIEFATPE